MLHNCHPTDPLPVVYFATFPWYLRIFLHTLTIKSAGKEIKPGKDASYSQCSIIIGGSFDWLIHWLFNPLVERQIDLMTKFLSRLLPDLPFILPVWYLTLFLASKQAFIICAARRAFFRSREDLRRVGERFVGVWHQ